MRHDTEEPPVRGYAVTHPGGGAVLPQSAGWDQLIYASSGVMTVHAGDGIWVVPPDRAVWVPATVPHRIEMSGRTAVRTLYFRTGLVPLSGTVPGRHRRAAAARTDRHAVPRCPLRLTEPREQRLIGVIIDQLAEAPTAPLRLPRPTDPRANEVALVLLSHATARIPDDRGSLTSSP